jgi:hypothetical protein
MSEHEHFWSAYYFVGPKTVERRCFYCGATVREGEAE